MPGDGPALLGVPDTEFLSIKRVMCKTVDNKTTSSKFYLQISHVPDSQNCKTNKDLQAKLDKDCKSKDKTNVSNYHNSSKSKTSMPYNLNSSDNKEADKRASDTITNRLHNEFNDLFSGIGCFKGMFSLQVKEGSHPDQAPLKRVAYALQKPLKEELSWLQKQQIMAQLGVDETSEWCNSFILVPKANGKVRLV